MQALKFRPSPLPDLNQANPGELASRFLAPRLDLNEVLRDELELDGPLVSTAGPSQVYRFTPEIHPLVPHLNEAGHREPWAKTLYEMNARATMTGLGIPIEQQNPQDGWTVHYQGSGSNFIRSSLEGVAFEEGTVIVDNDAFSEVAVAELKDLQRAEGLEVVKFEAGKGLTVDSEEYAKIVEGMREGRVKTLYITLNATTAGVSQKEALEALVELRDVENLDVVIIADAVSAQWYGAKWSRLPDVLFTSMQKDGGLGSSYAVGLSNRRARNRSQELARAGLSIGGKLGIGHAADYNNPPQTPPTERIFGHLLVNDAMQHLGWQQRVAGMQEEFRASLQAATSAGGGLSRWGIGMLVKNPGLASLSSHLLTLPDGMNAGVVRKALRELGCDLSTGYGKGPAKDSRIRVCAYSPIPDHTGPWVVEALAHVAENYKH